MSMKYYLIDGTEVNCNVYLEEDGVLDVSPLDPSRSFGFIYVEVGRNGMSKECIWYSEHELSGNGLYPLPPDDEITEEKFDSNI